MSVLPCGGHPRKIHIPTTANIYGVAITATVAVLISKRRHHNLDLDLDLDLESNR